MTRPLLFAVLACILSGCSAAGMDYFWHGDGMPSTPRAPQASDNWLENTRKSGEKARYEYDMKAASEGRGFGIPDRSSYGF